MKVLLDTHVILFVYGEEDRLSATARGVLDAEGSELFLSAVSIYEILGKHRLGKLPQAGRFVRDWPEIVARDSLTLIDLTANHAGVAATFDVLHRDPFDRMLAAQALVEGMVLLSADAALDGFGVERIW